MEAGSTPQLLKPLVAQGCSIAILATQQLDFRAILIFVDRTWQFTTLKAAPSLISNL